jgi:hypothetical protein
MLKEKKDNRLTVSVHPFNLFKLDYKRAVGEKLGVDISSAYYVGLSSINFGTFYYLNKEKFHIDLGGGFQYLKNYSNINGLPDFRGGYYKQKFNMSFYSPYLMGSFILKTKESVSFGISAKSSYNFIGTYDYYQYIGSYQGHQNPQPLDEETLTKKPNPFLSFEPALNLYCSSNKTTLKLQLGYNSRYPFLQHDYNFVRVKGAPPPGIIYSSNKHPTINSYSFNISFIIYFRKNKKVVQ